MLGQSIGGGLCSWLLLMGLKLTMLPGDKKTGQECCEMSLLMLHHTAIHRFFDLMYLLVLQGQLKSAPIYEVQVFARRGLAGLREGRDTL